MKSLRFGGFLCNACVVGQVDAGNDLRQNVSFGVALSLCVITIRQALQVVYMVTPLDPYIGNKHTHMIINWVICYPSGT